MWQNQKWGKILAIVTLGVNALLALPGVIFAPTLSLKLDPASGVLVATGAWVAAAVLVDVVAVGALGVIIALAKRSTAAARWWSMAAVALLLAKRWKKPPRRLRRPLPLRSSNWERLCPRA